MPTIAQDSSESRALAESLACGEREIHPRGHVTVPEMCEEETPLRAALKHGAPTLVSTLLHGILLFVLGLWSVAIPESEEFKIASALKGVEEEMEEFADFELEELELTEQEELASEMSAVELEPVDMSDLSASELLSVTPLPELAASFDTSDLMLSGLGKGNQGLGESLEMNSGTMASFFGTKSRGNRIVFVVDSSCSMVQGRMHTTLIEIVRSVSQMTQKQSFSVILFSDQVYPMFFPSSIDEMLPATAENKQKLAMWLNTIELCIGGQMVEAIEMAATLRPHVVYVLSDGGPSIKAIETLKEENQWRFVINTLGMTVRDEEAQQRLVSLAKTFGGVYRPVYVNPVARELAKQQRFPANNKGPGRVWGTKVRVRTR
ncbi:hypothetical protein CA13_50720 [Planctomycetes bacterium CA13]|uniref:VWFA domain-containing protein n=1 Tax=Novipirellula herctigrandis TaxID=2527986 RepID=A0A5C5Z8T4_9BACT|nr:hypothetical protein CA13_50720 [Planctomycetes bacterium CA13]